MWSEHGVHVCDVPSAERPRNLALNCRAASGPDSYQCGQGTNAPRACVAPSMNGRVKIASVFAEDLENRVGAQPKAVQEFDTLTLR